MPSTAELVAADVAARRTETPKDYYNYERDNFRPMDWAALAYQQKMAANTQTTPTNKTTLPAIATPAGNSNVGTMLPGYANTPYANQYGTSYSGQRYDLTSPEVKLEMQKYPGINPDVAIGNVLKQNLPSTWKQTVARDYWEEQAQPGDVLVLKNGTGSGTNLSMYDEKVLDLLKNGGGYINQDGNLVYTQSPVALTSQPITPDYSTYVNKVIQEMLPSGEQYDSALQQKLNEINQQYDDLYQKQKLAGEQRYSKNRVYMSRLGIMGASTAAPAALEGIEQQNTDTLNQIEQARQSALTAAKIEDDEMRGKAQESAWTKAFDVYKNYQSQYQWDTEQKLKQATFENNKFLAQSQYLNSLMKDEREKTQADREFQLDLLGKLANISTDQMVEIDGLQYSGLKEISPDTYVSTITDPYGNVSALTLNKTTGEVINLVSLGAIGKGFKGSYPSSTTDYIGKEDGFNEGLNIVADYIINLENQLGGGVSTDTYWSLINKFAGDLDLSPSDADKMIINRIQQIKGQNMTQQLQNYEYNNPVSDFVNNSNFVEPYQPITREQAAQNIQTNIDWIKSLKDKYANYGSWLTNKTAPQ